MILSEKQINELPYDTCVQLLNILYIIEDQLGYKCKKKKKKKKITRTIDYLQKILL